MYIVNWEKRIEKYVSEVVTYNLHTHFTKKNQLQSVYEHMPYIYGNAHENVLFIILLQKYIFKMAGTTAVHISYWLVTISRWKRLDSYWSVHKLNTGNTRYTIYISSKLILIRLKYIYLIITYRILTSLFFLSRFISNGCNACADCMKCQICPFRHLLLVTTILTRHLI